MLPQWTRHLDGDSESFDAAMLVVECLCWARSSSSARAGCKSRPKQSVGRVQKFMADGKHLLSCRHNADKSGSLGRSRRLQFTRCTPRSLAGSWLLPGPPGDGWI